MCVCCPLWKLGGPGAVVVVVVVGVVGVALCFGVPSSDRVASSNIFPLRAMFLHITRKRVYCHPPPPHCPCLALCLALHTEGNHLELYHCCWEFVLTLIKLGMDSSDRVRFAMLTRV